MARRTYNTSYTHNITAAMLKQVERERRQREINQMQENVEEINNNIKSEQDLYENISKKDLQLARFDYDAYYNNMIVRLVVNDYIPLAQPNIEEEKEKFGVIKENKLLENINKTRKEKRLNKEKEFDEYWNNLIKEYEKAEANNKKEYQKYVENEKNKCNVENAEVIKKKKAYLSGDPNEFGEIFQNYFSKFKPPFSSIKKISFEYDNKILCLDLEFIDPDIELKTVKEVKFVQSKKEIKQILYSNHEQEDIYEKIVFGVIMYLIAKISFFFNNMIDRIIVNGYVNKINTTKGIYEDVNFVSVDINTNEIPYGNLRYIDPQKFLDSKGARYLTPLKSIKAVNRIEFENEITNEEISSNISGIDFEHISKSLLEKNGFEDVIVTKSSGDYGADVIATKEGVKYAIQCKKYSSKVGVEAVQEVIASKSVYNCHVGVVLTNNFFTPNAIKLAEANGILLWDANKLQELIDKKVE